MARTERRSAFGTVYGAVLLATSLLAAGGMSHVWAGQGPGVRSAALRIVVVEGEDAVNIIQQKTATAPVVEVRDRNDQPVAGALVRFAVSKGRATLNGARVLSVTTDAAGRAAVTGLTPTGTGALQISATATFQGQSAAIAIAQTNVMTAAEAAQVVAASGASGGGGAGGAAGAGAGAGGTGGGLSATTLAIVGGAAAGGALVATQVLDLGGGGGTRYRGPFSGILTTVAGGCNFDQQETGTIELNITASDSGTVTGDAQVEAVQTVVRLPPQCGGGNLTLGATEKHGCCDPAPKVSGTAQNLSFSGSHPGNIGSNWTYAFRGALSGSEVTGIFTLTVQAPGFGGTTDIPATLTRQ